MSICASDWLYIRYGLRRILGHELAGLTTDGRPVVVEALYGCGTCEPCRRGEYNLCPTHAERALGVSVDGGMAEQFRAPAERLVAVPDGLDLATAAALGCRYATAFRAVVQVAQVRAGEWVAVHGCGGVGLSAVQIAAAAGARVIAVDVNPAALQLARDLGAERAVDGAGDVPLAVADLTGGGAHVSLDALGAAVTCANSIRSLRPRGRHVQVGLLPPAQGRPEVPMERVIALELQVLGSHGMAAHAYPEMLGLIAAGRLDPRPLVTRELSLDEAGAALSDVGRTPGIAVVTGF
jgi:alcohol dehydrogenase